MMFRIPGWAGLPMIGAALAGGVWSIRTGFADSQIRRETVRGVERAILAAPDNAEYYARLAWLASDNDPQKAKDALRHAVLLNPRDAGSWIDLGLQAEVEGDDGRAEQCLLRAFEVDRKFLPRWTLANYYFRRHDEARFWQWMKKAMAMSYGDVQPIFRLCGKVEENGRLMERLEMRNPDLRAGYLAYLISQNRMDLTGPTVELLLEEKREADLPLLLTVCERFLDAGRGDEAAAIWGRLARSGRVAPRENGLGVVNGSFALAPTSHGLDWRLPVVEGISVAREEERSGLRITFSGREPEGCQVLMQWIPVEDRKYELAFRYRTHGMESGAGLTWRITAASDEAVLAESPILASEAEATGRLLFEPPPKCRLVRLAVAYRRARGTTRMEGFLVLQNVALNRPAQLPADGVRFRK